MSNNEGKTLKVAISSGIKACPSPSKIVNQSSLINILPLT